MNTLTPYRISFSEIDPEIDRLREGIFMALGKLGHGLCGELVSELSKGLEIVNSYYSNRIEGNPTKISEVFDAVISGDISGDSAQRDYKLEHLSHVETSNYFRKYLLENKNVHPTDKNLIISIHKFFFEKLPESLRIAKTHSGKEVKIIPGQLRDRFVTIGRLIPPDPEDLENLLDQFSKAYLVKDLEPSERLMSIAAAHHRFLYIHPFSDGNGRIARLITELMLADSGYYGNGLYSISRGFARNHKNYNSELAKADLERRHAADGRGARTLEGLQSFTKFFLHTLNDQLGFMSNLLSRESLDRRLDLFIKKQVAIDELSEKESRVLKFIFHFGSLTRGSVQEITGLKERQSRTIINSMLKKGFLKSPTPKGKLYFNLAKKLREEILKEFFVED